MLFKYAILIIVIYVVYKYVGQSSAMKQKSIKDDIDRKRKQRREQYEDVEYEEVD